jgi:hypothetical protein
MEAPVLNLIQKFGGGVWCRVDWRRFKLAWHRFNETTTPTSRSAASLPTGLPAIPIPMGCLAASLSRTAV